MHFSVVGFDLGVHVGNSTCSLCCLLLGSSAFSTFFDGNHGNCYTFNSGWNDDDGTDVLKTSRTGREHGLQLTVRLGQEDYIEQIGEGAGAVAVVHPQQRFPFPEDEGILLEPGRINSIGVREVIGIHVQE